MDLSRPRQRVRGLHEALPHRDGRTLLRGWGSRLSAGAEISDCCIASVPKQERVLGFPRDAEQARSGPIPSTGGVLMKRVTGLRALGAALMLSTLTDAEVLVTPGVGGAASTSSATFGTLPSPCGKGHDTGATDKGVTNSTINLAYGDDRGFSGLPGLDQEMGDAVKDMISWCNAQGGIGGRKIVGDYYDAAVLNVGSVMNTTCGRGCMLVGEGLALAGTAGQTRLGCNLAA